MIYITVAILQSFIDMFFAANENLVKSRCLADGPPLSWSGVQRHF